MLTIGIDKECEDDGVEMEKRRKVDVMQENRRKYKTKNMIKGIIEEMEEKEEDKTIR